MGGTEKHTEDTQREHTETALRTQTENTLRTHSEAKPSHLGPENLIEMLCA